MNIERLTHLIAILEGVRDARLGFDLESFANAPAIPHACGTTACAAGYAALDPVFQAQGLRLQLIMLTRQKPRREHRLRFEPSDLAVFNEVAAKPELLFFSARPVYKDASSFHALECFFEIGVPASYRLFSPIYYSRCHDPQLVIDRVQRLIELGEESFVHAYYEVANSDEDDEEDL